MAPEAPLRSITLASSRYAGIAVWGDAPVDDEIGASIDLTAATVVVRHTHEGRAIVHTYAITTIDDD